MLVRETVDYSHLCQDCIDELGFQEFVEGPWDVEEQSRYDHYG